MNKYTINCRIKIAKKINIAFFILQFKELYLKYLLPDLYMIYCILPFFQPFFKAFATNFYKLQSGDHHLLPPEPVVANSPNSFWQETRSRLISCQMFPCSLGAFLPISLPAERWSPPHAAAPETRQRAPHR